MQGKKAKPTQDKKRNLENFLLFHTFLLQDPCGNNCMSLLTSHLLVTGGQGHIQLIDLERGEILRTVSVGSSDKSAFVNQIHVVQNSVIVCDYASEMKVIQFPTVLEKAE